MKLQADEYKVEASRLGIEIEDLKFGLSSDEHVLEQLKQRVIRIENETQSLGLRVQRNYQTQIL